MSLEISGTPPRIRVTDTDGHVTFDSTYSLFHVTDTLTGSVALTTWNAPPHNSVVEHSIGSCHPDSTFVRGVMRCSYTGTPILMFPDSGWFNINGSFVQVAYVYGIRHWHFQAVSGSVKLIDHCYLHSISNEFGQILSTLGSITVQYHLDIGRFSP